MIRWGQADEQKLKVAVRRFNAKLSYNARKHQERMSYLPDRLSVKELRKEFKAGSREDFVRKITSILRFSRRGYEMPYTTQSNVQMSLWEKKEIDNRFRAINRERKRLAKMKRMEFVPLTHNIETITPKNFEQYKRAIMFNKGEKEIRWRANYLKSIRNVFGEGELYEFVEQTPLPQLLNALENSAEIMDIHFIYEPREVADKSMRITRAIQGSKQFKYGKVN